MGCLDVESRSVASRADTPRQPPGVAADLARRFAVVEAA